MKRSDKVLFEMIPARVPVPLNGIKPYACVLMNFAMAFQRPRTVPRMSSAVRTVTVCGRAGSVMVTMTVVTTQTRNAVSITFIQTFKSNSKFSIHLLWPSIHMHCIFKSNVP